MQRCCIAMMPLYTKRATAAYIRNSKLDLISKPPTLLRARRCAPPWLYLTPTADCAVWHHSFYIINFTLIIGWHNAFLMHESASVLSVAAKQCTVLKCFSTHSRRQPGFAHYKCWAVHGLKLSATTAVLHFDSRNPLLLHPPIHRPVLSLRIASFRL